MRSIKTGSKNLARLRPS